MDTRDGIIQIQVWDPSLDGNQMLVDDRVCIDLMMCRILVTDLDCEIFDVLILFVIGLVWGYGMCSLQ